MTDPDVTDDDLRKARLWAEKVDPPHTNPGYSGTPRDIYNAARVIRAHVPAPPATLADEICKADWNGLGDQIIAGRFADRVEAVVRERDEARAEVERLKEEFEEGQFERSVLYGSWKMEEKAHERASAEVERLTSIIKNHPDSEYVFAPGGVIGKQAKENLDQMNTDTGTPTSNTITEELMDPDSYGEDTDGPYVVFDQARMMRIVKRVEALEEMVK